MAKYIGSVALFGPRIAPGKTVELDELAERLSDTTGQRRGEIMRVLLELEETLLFFCRRGRAVDVPGIGKIRPVIRGDGTIRLSYRPQRRLIAQLQLRELFLGEILNEENIGLTPEQYKELWDAEHPDDPLELPRLRAS